MSLAKVDIFGSSIGLNFKRESVYKTRFGGTVSLLFFAFVGVFFYSQVSIQLSMGFLIHGLEGLVIVSTLFLKKNNGHFVWFLDYLISQKRCYIVFLKKMQKYDK